MTMKPQRREKILASLCAGNEIQRVWSGTRRRGHLSHRLEGVNNLRESEVEALKNDGLIQLAGKSSALRFSNLRLKEGALRSHMVSCRGVNFHVFTLGADKCSVCGALR